MFSDTVDNEQCFVLPWRFEIRSNSQKNSQFHEKPPAAHAHILIIFKIWRSSCCSSVTLVSSLVGCTTLLAMTTTVNSKSLRTSSCVSLSCELGVRQRMM